MKTLYLCKMLKHQLLVCLIAIGFCNADAQTLKAIFTPSSTNKLFEPSNIKPVPTEKFDHEFKLDSDGNY